MRPVSSSTSSPNPHTGREGIVMNGLTPMDLRFFLNKVKESQSGGCFLCFISRSVMEQEWVCMWSQMDLDVNPCSATV